MRRIGRFLLGLAPAALAGGFFLLTVMRTDSPAETGRIAPLIFGAVYGAVTVGLIRLFPVAAWAYPIVGLLVGPVPYALVASSQISESDRGGLWLLTALLGALIGFLEWAREQHAQRGQRGQRETAARPPGLP